MVFAATKCFDFLEARLNEAAGAADASRAMLAKPCCAGTFCSPISAL